MHIAIVSPALRLVRFGNRVTSLRWALFLRKLGHRVQVRSADDETDAELLIALHAEKSARAVRAYRSRRPDGRVIVALTGTDLYRPGGLSATALEVLGMATRVVVLQPRAVEEIPDEHRGKTRALLQSACAVEGRERATLEPSTLEPGGELRVAAIGHLRPVKNPLLAAAAARLLPPDSRLHIVHVGASLDDDLAARAESESRSNPRWSWIGPLPRRAALERLAGAQLALSTSQAEGGSNMLSEALAAGVPVLVTAVPGNLGILGDDWPGAFPVDDAQALAMLLERWEREPGFRAELAARTRALAHRVRPEAECAAWRDLLEELRAEVPGA